MTERNAVDEGMELAVHLGTALIMETLGKSSPGWAERANASVEAVNAFRAHLQAMQDRIAALERVAEAGLTWECTGGGLKRFMTDKQYNAQTPGIQKWYRPVCQKCAALALLEPKGKEKQG